MSFYEKYLKYKTKYISLKNQIAGNSYQIIETNSNSSVLKYIGSGVPNFVYLDEKLNVIIKIRKNSYRDLRADFIDYSNSFEEKTTILTTDESILDYLSKFKEKFKSESSVISFDMIKKYIDASKIINELPTFLKFKGFIVYYNIGISNISGNVETPLVLPSFEYLNNVTENFLSDKELNFKAEILSVIYDFKKYNSLGYVHRDLQNLCRNIVSYNNSGTRKLKVIDLDNPVYFITNKCDLNNLVRELLQDYVSLYKCLIHMKFFTEMSENDICNETDICTFIRSLDLDITVIDTTIFSKTNDYPEYKLTLLGDWTLMDNGSYKITGKYGNGNKIVDIFINNNALNFRNIEIKYKDCNYCVLNINLVKNKEKIKNYIESIYDKLIRKASFIAF